MLDSTWNWAGFNMAADAVRRRLPGRSAQLRYEDFASDPESTVRAVLALLGEPADRCPVGDTRVTLGGNHTVTGNPDRFITGTLEICEDHTWRNSLPVHLSTAATAMALPWLGRYGYPILADRDGSHTPKGLTPDAADDPQAE